MATATRTPVQARLYDEGATDATAGRPAAPPDGGAALADAYNDGYSSATPAEKPKTDKGSSPAKGRSSGPARTPSRPGRSKKSSRSRGRRRPPSYRKAANAIRGPVEGQLVSGMTTIGMAVGIAVLFNALANAKAIGGALDAMSKGLTWLDAPTSITYKK